MQWQKVNIPESVALLPDLLVEFVVCDEVDVLDPVVLGDGDVAAVGLQVVNGGRADVLRHDGEVQAQVLDVPVVRLDLE